MTDDIPVKKPATARKTGLAAKPALKAVAKTGGAAAAKPSGASVPAAVEKAAVAPVTLVKVKANVVKIKDVLEAVAKTQGGKKKGMKEVVEATLATLGAAFARGDAVNLPGFGRARVAQAEDTAAGRPMTIKMKSGTGPAQKKPGKLGLADAED